MASLLAANRLNLSRSVMFLYFDGPGLIVGGKKIIQVNNCFGIIFIYLCYEKSDSIKVSFVRPLEVKS
jgi:hypothetical protein